MHIRPWPLPSGGFLKKPADKALIFLLKTIYFIIKILNLHHYFTPNFFLVDMDYFDTVISLHCVLFHHEIKNWTSKRKKIFLKWAWWVDFKNGKNFKIVRWTFDFCHFGLTFPNSDYFEKKIDSIRSSAFINSLNQIVEM